MNILLTCAGRRNYMVSYFQEALANEGKVYTVNSTPEATAMLVSDGAFVAPKLYEKEYTEFLLNICRKYNIGLLVSLFDLELPILAENKHLFEEAGVQMSVSSDDVISICNDKCETVRFVEKLSQKTLFTTCEFDEAVSAIENGFLRFPLFIKPRWGMGSIAMQKVYDMDELHVLFRKVRRGISASYLEEYHTFDPDASVIIQEAAKGQEYGLDVVNDLNGNYVTTFVKRKLDMRSGETEGAVTVDEPELKELGKKIGTLLKHTGNLDVDLFWDRQGEPVILEMNARFGGGYPFSHLAGANLPKAYISWAEGKKAADKDLSITYGVKGFKGLTMLNANQLNILGSEE